MHPQNSETRKVWDVMNAAGVQREGALRSTSGRSAEPRRGLVSGQGGVGGAKGDPGGDREPCISA